MSYLLPSGEERFAGACACEDVLCAWSDRTAYRWSPEAGWTSLSPAPAPIDSGFEVQSGLLAGANTYVGFLPSGNADWAWWADLSAFSDAHPMYGNLLLCPDRSAGVYTLFSISAAGLDRLSRFGAGELSEPVAGWSPPTTPDRLLLLGDDGLWALDPPYASDALQPLVSFDGVDLPPREDIPGPFQPGDATVVIPRRTRTALRLDLSDGTGEATGLKHLRGGAALWTTYLNDERTAANCLLATLAALPVPPSGPTLRLHDVLMNEGAIPALVTSAGLRIPADESERAETVSPPETAATLIDSPLDGPALATWALWLGWDDAQETGCRLLCNTRPPDYALVDSLRQFAGTEACHTLFDLLRSSAPPSGPEGKYDYPAAALRAFVAPFGPDVASLVTPALSAASIPVRTAASAAAGATHADLPSDASAESLSSGAVLWTDREAVPTDALRRNAMHDHPAVRTAARNTCARLSIEPGADTSYSRRSSQSSQPDSPK